MREECWAREGFDPADVGAHGALSEDLEALDLAGPVHMGATTELDGEVGNLDDPDPNKRALAQRNALFDDPEVQSEAGRIDFEVFERKLAALARAENWTREQVDYIFRNTNRRPIPRVLFDSLSAAAKKDITRSHTARLKYLRDVGATQEVISAYERAFFAVQ